MKEQEVKKILKRFENTAFYPYSSSVVEALAKEICQLFEPKSEKPPVLSDEEMAKLWRLSQDEAANVMCEFDATELVMLKIAQAQRDAGAQWCEAKIEQAYKEGYEQAQNNLTKPEILNIARESLEQAKAEMAREILNAVETDGAVTFLDSHQYQNKKLWAFPYEVWQALKARFLGEDK